MLFYTFKTQAERKDFGGSAFIEIQFCKLAHTTDISKLTDIDNIKNWKNDSLYVYIDDDSIFYKEYRDILGYGVYCNLESGLLDLYGINYYAPSLIASIKERLMVQKPNGYEIFHEWLSKAEEYNGFYILGI